MKKKLLFTLMVAFMSISTLMPAYASALTVDVAPAMSSLVITPRIEVTRYYYKTINGKEHKRLWSVTYNHWIDDMWYPV